MTPTVQQEEGFPASVEALAEQIRNADGVSNIVTPEYITIPFPALKKVIDWSSCSPEQPCASFLSRPQFNVGAIGGALPVSSAPDSGVFLDDGDEQTGVYGRRDSIKSTRRLEKWWISER